jgi:hypothetical protein
VEILALQDNSYFLIGVIVALDNPQISLAAVMPPYPDILAFFEN